MTIVTLQNFGSFSINSLTREIFCGGQLQAVPPRVFDLLSYLIEHRDRVVTKDELITRVWGDAIVSASVVARAVMKARAAIGDSVDESAQIRTVHRVGYRFVGQAREAVAPRAPAAPTPVAGPRPARVHLALTPIRNATGSPQLAWVELGLLSMIMQPLESDSRLAVASVSAVLAALQSKPAAAEDREQDAVLLASLIGADWVLSTSLAMDGGEYGLRYVLAGRHGVRHSGRLHAANPVALGALVSAKVLNLLFQDDVELHRERSDDVFVNQVISRGLQAFVGLRMDSAIKLFEVALDIEPNNEEVRLKHVQALLRVGSGRALPLALELLADIVSRADHRLIATTHCTVATAYRQVAGSDENILHHIDEALRCIGNDNSEIWALRLYYSCINLLRLRGHRERAIGLFDMAFRCVEASADKLQWLYFTDVRAHIEYTDGNLLTSRDLWQRTLELFRRFDLVRPVIDGCSHLADVNAALGDMATALRYCDDGVATLRTLTIPEYAAHAANFCVRYAEAWQAQAIDEVIEGSRGIFERLGGANASQRWVALSQQAACEDRFVEAREHLERALANSLEYQEIGYARQWAALLLHTLMRAGEFEPAAARATELLAHALPDTPELQGLALHAQALEQHRLGRVDASRALIRRACDLLPPGRWSALAKLDGAWLDIESGAPAAARQTLSDTHYWLREHPLGQIVQARLLYEQGGFAEAVRLHACGLAWGCRRARAHERTLAALYEQAARTGRPQALPRADALPSTA
jgi:DNA-binding winged helix-turn-helix (wHTH) protein/tetratricopeptide (TPR) repeat protein